MIIWSGLGFLVPIIGLGCLFLAQVATGSLFQDTAYYQNNGWPKLAGLLTAAALTYLLSTLLDRQPGRAVIDKTTGRELVLKPRHSLFFVPLKYWSYVFVALGIVFMFA